MALGSIGSEEKVGFAIHCHGVERIACPVGEQKRGGEPQTQFSPVAGYSAVKILRKTKWVPKQICTFVATLRFALSTLKLE
jgi:hypothetical protein